MEASKSASVAMERASSFGQDHFGACDLGHRRRTARAVQTADALLRHPAGTLPDKLPRKQLLGYYKLANNPRVNHDNLQAAHCQRTRDLASRLSGSVVLFVHDTTEADYSGLTIPDLGPIGKGTHRGLLLHHVLAVSYSAGGREVLGLMAQILHCRRRVPRRESKGAMRRHPQRESRLWVKGVQAVGQAPPDATWINLMDRGGDTFECLERQCQLGQGFVVRSSSNRGVRVLDKLGRKRPARLHDWARKLPALGQRTVNVDAQQNQPARTATVRVAAGAVEVPAPRQKRGEHSDQPLDLWVVHVREIDPPAGAAPLEWFLLTSVPTVTGRQAGERIDWYECRPAVEELHKAQKTGCGMELAQFTTRKALEVHIAMISVVAVQMLRLRDLSRRPDAEVRRADEVVDADHIEVLSLWCFKEVRADLSVRQFLHALARLGGHLGRTHDRVPGWLVLWRGWSQLQRLVEGAQLIRLKRSG